MRRWRQTQERHGSWNQQDWRILGSREALGSLPGSWLDEWMEVSLTWINSTRRAPSFVVVVFRLALTRLSLPRASEEAGTSKGALLEAGRNRFTAGLCDAFTQIM